MLQGGYGSFRERAPPETRALLDSLREYCLSLGNVVEDIRAHRIVFGKSFSFRWFADAEPTGESVLLRISRGRREQAAIAEIRDGKQLEEAKELIRDAFLSIR